jgi:hypothetical protein
MASALCLAACGATEHDDQRSGPGACSSAHALVSGRVERDLEQTHQYAGEISLGRDSAAVIGLYSNPALGGDGPSTLVAEQRIAPVPPLPFDYCITGTPPADAEPSVEYYASVNITQHRDSTENQVGDLITETTNVVTPPATNVVLLVTGLESCKAPDAGGFCVGN